MITKETIDKIFDAVRIEEVIGDFVSDLKKKGVNYMACCPFHDEKTPSFSVSPSKGIYKCFGCGKGGNAINFVMEHEHFTYPEALRYLAKKYNIEIEEKQMTKKQVDNNNEKSSLFLVNEFARDFFIKNLNDKSEGNKIGLSYLLERGISNEMINLFEIGYALENNNNLSTEIISNSFDKDLVVKSGLSKEKGDQLYDFFNTRVIFPIHSFSGRVLGFGARTIGSKSKIKYLNSPENSIYQKSKILYGIYFSKNEIIKKNNCFIVEGYTDVISFHQNNIKNVVSSSGTALSKDQIKLISRFSKNITLIFDSDDAGVKAAFRNIDLILSEGMNVKIVKLPDGEDPDSLTKKYNSSELIKFIDDSTKDFITYKTEMLRAESEKDPVKRAENLREIIKSIASVPDYLTRTEYCKICSAIFKINEKELLGIVSRNKSIRLASSNRQKTKERLVEKETKLTLFEKEILRLILNYGNETIHISKEEINLTKFFIEELEYDDLNFTLPKYKILYSEIVNNFKETENIEAKYFLNNNQSIIQEIAIDLMSNKHNISVNWQKRHNIFTSTESDSLSKTAEKALLNLKHEHLENQINELKKTLNIENKALVNKFKSLVEIRKEIAQKLGRK